jgi:Fe-S-cluster formation regulator IscX/YfhJ
MKKFIDYVNEQQDQSAIQNVGQTMNQLSIQLRKLKDDPQVGKHAETLLQHIKQAWEMFRQPSNMPVATPVAKMANLRLPPTIQHQLMQYPNLSRAVNQLSQEDDVAKSLENMLSVNIKKFASWEQQMTNGHLTAQGLKDKILKNGFYSPFRY